MSVISLITDFGLSDNFVGIMKAVILKINPRARIIDICHEINAQDINQAAFLLRSSFRYFPPQTVHLAVVDPQVGSQRKKIIVKTKNYYFVAPDNGVLALALKDEPAREIVEITNARYFLRPFSSTFHGRDIFAPVAAYLSKTGDVHRFGRRIKSFQDLKLPQVKVSPKSLIGEILHVDRFGNLISNIDRDTLYNFIRNSAFKIYLKNKSIDKVSASYSEVARLKPLALINSFNYLEVSLNCGSARDYFAAGRSTKIKLTKS